MSCPPRVKLLALLADGIEVPHLQECADCAEFVAAATAAVKAFDGRRSRADRALEALVDEVLTDVPSRNWRSQLVLARELHRSAVVREILRRAEREYENPRLVVDLTESAVALCDAMTQEGTPPDAELFIEALKEHAAALRCSGYLDDALKAIGQASALAAGLKDREHWNAILWLCTALIYVEPDQGKYDEAIVLAENAAAVLDVCGDERRALLARQTKAQALATKQDFRGALSISLAVASDLEAVGAPLDIAVAHHLVAHCCVGVAAYEEALHYVALARQHYEAGGYPVLEARVSHERARALAALGRMDEARSEFMRTAEVVFNARLFDVWAIFRLDYIAAALHDDPAANLRAEVELVAHVCLTLGGAESTLRRRYAAEALEYLRMLAIRDALTAEAADYVRDFVSRNASRPPVRFTPPRGGQFLM